MRLSLSHHTILHPIATLEHKMDSTDDIYKETIDYIKQIEKEIVFTLDDDHLEWLDGCITSKDINSYCDILLDKISKELYITANLEKDDLDCNLLRDPMKSDLHSDNYFPSSLVSTHSNNNNTNTQSSIQTDKDFPSNVDKITNYRYSFYDNSNKISIYIAPSSVIDQVLKENNCPILNNIEKEAAHLNIFGAHPCSIQLNFHGSILPVFIESALVYLSKFGLASVGLFRKSGVKSRINGLKKQIELGEKIEFNSLCVYDVADLVKTWFRDLRPHLISTELIDSFVCCKENFSLWQLADSHRYLLFVVLKFLSQVSSHSKQNQMTVHNLAICFAPSLCQCETEHHILNAQKCLEYCIENFESLFYISINATTAKVPSVLNRHTATAIINASPRDILNRILYERNSIDPLISEWTIKDKTKNNDIFEMNLQFSSFLPNKTLQLKRNWTFYNNNSILLEEYADMFNSTWHLKPNGQGQTQVIHELELDLRGFSHNWYQTTFAVVHNTHLKLLNSSFQIDSPDANLKLNISEV